MDLFKRNSTIAFLVIALFVIVVVGFWFKKPVVTNGSSSLPVKGAADAAKPRVNKSDK